MNTAERDKNHYHYVVTLNKYQENEKEKVHT